MKSRFREKINKIFSLSSKQDLAKNHPLTIQRLVHLLDQLNQGKRCSLGTYFPIQFEVDWRGLLPIERYDLLFPRTDRKHLRFYYASLDQLVPAADFKNLLVPPEAKLGVPELVLVPGLAFDKKGNRLGRGKGYYDRYLANYKGLKIGLCHQIQLFDEIPCDFHDVKMDYIIYEDGMIKV